MALDERQNMRAARILILDTAPQFGGHELMLCEIVRELHLGVQAELHLAAVKDARLDKELAPFVRSVTVVPASGSRGGWLSLFRALWFLRRTVRPDIVLVANGYLGEVLNVLLSRCLFKRVVVYTPLIVSFKEMAVRRASFKDAVFRHFTSRLPHAWIVLTPGQVNRFRELSRTSAPLYYIENVLRNEFLQAQPQVGSRPDVLPSVMRVLVIGRLDVHHKGLDFLAHHLVTHAEVLRGRFRFSIVGDGAGGAFLDEAALPSFVDRKGWANARQEISTHDVVLLTSRFEGVPLVMLEAMALGVPVVCSDLPSIRDYLDAEQRFPVGEIGLAFAAIDRLRNPAVHADVVQRNRDVLLRRNGRQAFESAVRNVFAALLDRPASSAADVAIREQI
jgi:glycosyltransferase involved in cell wall biosynthesis